MWGKNKILEPRQVFDDETGSSGQSLIFAAQWYPCVSVIIVRTGGTSHSLQLQGSFDKTNWVDVGNAITGDFGNNVVTNFGNVWFPFWRLDIGSNDGSIDAWIGAGGA